MENKEDLRERIGEEAYNVTQEGATERPFTGKYYKNEQDGMYHCVVCGAELFGSDTKFESHSGWPSFYDVKRSDAVKLVDDSTLGMTRTEVVCANCDAHLGHVFNDAPETPTGQRYCINSCSLSFADENGDDMEE